MNRYFFGFLVTIGLVILLIVLIFSGGSSKKPSSVPQKLSPYATTDAFVRMTIDGPVTAPQDHKVIRVTVNNSIIRFEKLVGYDGHVVDTHTFANTVNSYTVFLRSLTKMGYLKGVDDAALKDSSGYCPAGNTYNFDLNKDNKTITHYWASNCGGIKTYLGNLSSTVALFEAQIPDYDTLSADSIVVQ